MVLVAEGRQSNCYMLVFVVILVDPAPFVIVPTLYNPTAIALPLVSSRKDRYSLSYEKYLTNENSVLRKPHLSLFTLEIL
jgi:hypothetical protein